jgi:hypothetical protein
MAFEIEIPESMDELSGLMSEITGALHVSSRLPEWPFLHPTGPHRDLRTH